MMSRKKRMSNDVWLDDEVDPDAGETTQDFRANPNEHNSLHETLEKARELFQLCDKEEKGFITKRDMQRLQNELPLTPEQLEDVFNSLDQDKNGYLTPVEFSMGLGKFIGIKVLPTAERLEKSKHDETFESGWSEDLDIVADVEEKRFCFMMEQLGASQIFEDQSEVRELWARLRRGKPELLANFEQFLAKVSTHIQEMQQEKETMEHALKRKECEHDREVRCLYEEMEQQIKREKEKLLSQDVWKHNERNQQLERELKSKEQDLENIILQQKKLEQQFEEFNCEQTDVRMQNERLRRMNEELQEQLDRTKQDLDTMRYHLQILQEEARNEHQKKARDVLKVSKNMQKERESLLRQLELLREMNKKLRDEKDAHEAKKLVSLKKQLVMPKHSNCCCCCCCCCGCHQHMDPYTTPWGHSFNKEISCCGEERFNYIITGRPLSSPRKKPLLKRGSVIGNYLVEDKPVKRQLVTADLSLVTAEVTSEPSKKNCKYVSDGMGAREAGDEGLCSPTSTEDERLPDEAAGCEVAGLPVQTSGEEDEAPLSPRGQPIGTETLESEPASSSPDRMFKVVFIGNSGVGKSSFIHRFCYDRFLTETNATIGIDFQVKSLVVDNTRVALQLWDTAGQERFRSISKQYFRKADGVLVMYDVTSEVSFTAVRNWMASVQEGIDERAVICLLGNKIDVLNSETQRVSKAESERLAKEYNAVFYECSARSGYNIMEPLMHVARLLSEQEDKQREDALHLDDVCDKKKGCCK
ncbi:EF-hand calcium-binding domain-containing protein 4B-like [Pristis pectinata]|uniref:EF-hand calcium-binding domain-containing protein 4B-like n=1 Tax=Pristis pectinata TaxID=685728 RepID=UPI00223E3CBB|nr:EF-hand calcium-binding domain-containing protein 4B-like [Pristis pectinata]